MQRGICLIGRSRLSAIHFLMAIRLKLPISLPRDRHIRLDLLFLMKKLGFKGVRGSFFKSNSDVPQVGNPKSTFLYRQHQNKSNKRRTLVSGKPAA